MALLDKPLDPLVLARVDGFLIPAVLLHVPVGILLQGGALSSLPLTH